MGSSCRVIPVWGSMAAGWVRVTAGGTGETTDRSVVPVWAFQEPAATGQEPETTGNSTADGCAVTLHTARQAVYHDPAHPSAVELPVVSGS